MPNQFFPEPGILLDMVLEKFASEIRLRAAWIVADANSLNDLHSQMTPASELFRISIGLINHAMLIDRIIDEQGTGARNRQRHIERATLLRERWPNIPQPPTGLRDIRNDYEHFEERLDEWGSTSAHHLYDQNVGPMKADERSSNLRRLHRGVLYFWDHEVNLSQVVQWAQHVSDAVTD